MSFRVVFSPACLDPLADVPGGESEVRKYDTMTAMAVSTLPRILVVDDVSSMRIMTRRMTNTFRAAIDEMQSGEEFLQYALSDLLISQVRSTTS